MPSQKNMLRLHFAACLLLLCLSANAQPDDPNKGRRPAPRVPLTGVGWLVAAGALVGGFSLRRAARSQDTPSRSARVKSFLAITILTNFFAGVEVSAQQRMSVSDGIWESPSTWTDGVVPTPDNSTSVLVRHTVTVPAGSNVSIDNLVVDGGRLVVSPGGVLQIVDGDSTDMQLIGTGMFDVWGTVIGHDGISLEGLNGANTTFNQGSVYQHLASGEGSIPVARWHPQARFEITGISGNVSMHAQAWRQAWGTVVYNGATQGEFVDFKGLLETIQGDFIISSTRNSILRLSQSQPMHLAVGGDLIITGPSEVWFSQSDSCTLDVAGNFVFASTSGASSYFTTTGVAKVTIDGDLVVDAQHRLRMASGSATGTTALTVRGDVTFLSGHIDAAGTGSGTVTFAGSARQRVDITRNGDSGFEGNVNFRIEGGADVDLGTSLLANTTGGDLIIEGTLRLGSLSEAGAIQAGPEGNIQVAGSIAYGPASRLIYNGGGTQYLSYNRLETQVDILSTGAVVMNDIQFGGLNAGSSEFVAGMHTLSVQRDLYTASSLAVSTLVLNGKGEQRVHMPNADVHDLVVRQTEPGTVVLEQPLQLTGTLSIESPGTQVMANGKIKLISSSESAGGTASIAKLAQGASIVGDVIVQRFIAGGPGDHYRYISSPVENATVADLMDDIPVTGTFEDADQGGELPEDAPSLFYYSEEASEWVPFPVTGSADENRFDSGRGYCVFNWNGAADSNWDVTGTVHQGPTSLPVTYTESGDTAMRGWNLVGNPYPSTIRWGEEGWDSQHVSASIAVRDNLIGGFRYWDGDVGSLEDGLLALGQSFWVRTTGADPYLVINEDAKAGTGAEYYRKRPPDFLELSLSMEDLTDRAYLRIRKGASRELDAYDAPKMWNDSLSLAFQTDDGVPVAIHAVPRLERMERIPLEIRRKAGKEFSFHIQGFGALHAATFGLIDDATGTRYDFGPEGEITLSETVPMQLSLIIESTVDTCSDCNSKQHLPETHTQTHTMPDRHAVVAFPVPAAETVFLSGKKFGEQETVEIYRADGRLAKIVMATRATTGCLAVNLSGLTAGHYYLRLPGKKVPYRIRIVKSH